MERPIPTVSRIINSYYEHSSIELPNRCRRSKKLSNCDGRSLGREMKHSLCTPLTKIGNIFPNRVYL